jgi:hypothetical protein
MQLKERMVCPCLRLVLMSAGTTPILQQPSHVPTYSGLNTAHLGLSSVNKEQRNGRRKEGKIEKKMLIKSGGYTQYTVPYLFTLQENHFFNMPKIKKLKSQNDLTHFIVSSPCHEFR